MRNRIMVALLFLCIVIGDMAYGGAQVEWQADGISPANTSDADTVSVGNLSVSSGTGYLTVKSNGSGTAGPKTITMGMLSVTNQDMQIGRSGGTVSTQNMTITAGAISASGPTTNKGTIDLVASGHITSLTANSVGLTNYAILKVRAIASNSESNLTVTNGLNIADNSLVTVETSNGTANASASITTNTLNMTGGAMEIHVGTSVTANGVTMTGGTIQVTGSATGVANLNLHGTSNISDGTISLIGSTLTNSGTVNMSDGDFTLNYAATVKNTGTMTIGANVTVTNGANGSANYIDNSGGTFNVAAKNADSIFTMIDANAGNIGEVNVTTGTLAQALTLTASTGGAVSFTDVIQSSNTVDLGSSVDMVIDGKGSNWNAAVTAKSLTVKAQGETTLANVTAANGLTIGTGTSATKVVLTDYSTAYNTGIIVKSAAKIATAGTGGSVTVSGGLKTEGASTIAIGEGDDIKVGAASTVDLSSATRIVYDSDTTHGSDSNQENFITGAASLLVDGNSSMPAADRDALIAAMGGSNILGDLTLAVSGNDIVGYFTAVENTTSGKRGQMTKMGLNSRYLTDGLVDSLAGSGYTANASAKAGEALRGIQDSLKTTVDGTFDFRTASGVRFSGSLANDGVLGVLGGDTVAGVNQIATSSSLGVMDKIGERSYGVTSLANALTSSVGSDSATAATILNDCYLNRVWVGGFGQWEDADRRDGINGYKFKSHGFMMGYDRAFGPVIAGASFAYSNGDYEDKNAISHNSDIDSYSFSLYGTYNHCSGFFASAFGGYTYSDNDIDETYTANFRAKEDYHTNTWYAGAKVGYQKRMGNVTFTPSVGLSYINSRSSAHNTGVNGIDLVRVGRVKADTLMIPVEMRVGYDICTGADSKLNLNANVGYTYNFDDDAADGTAHWLGGTGTPSAIRTTGRESGKHTLNVGAGIRYQYKRFDVGVNYDYYAKSKFDAHRVMATAGISF